MWFGFGVAIIHTKIPEICKYFEKLQFNGVRNLQKYGIFCLPIKYSISIISRSTDPFFTNEWSLKSGGEGEFIYGIFNLRMN